MLEGDAQVRARAVEVEEMLRYVCGKDEFPWFVSDEATVFDVCSLTPDEIVDRLLAHYQVKVRVHDLRLPIWKLVERLTGVS